MLATTVLGNSGDAGAPRPAAVSDAVRERLIALARRYDEAAHEIAALAAGLSTGDTGEWSGPAAQACRNRLAEHARRLAAVAQDYREVAATVRAGAAVLAARLGTVERFADLGAPGAAVLAVLGGAGGAPALGTPLGTGP